MKTLIAVILLVLGIWIIYTSMSFSREAENYLSDARKQLDRAEALVEKGY